MQKTGTGGARQQHRKNFHKQQGRKSRAEGDEIAALEAALQSGAPPGGGGAAPSALPSASAEAGSLAAAKRFDELPISEYSKAGLREAKYVTMTAVQRAALPHALCGRDVLGAAKTGSGAGLIAAAAVGLQTLVPLPSI